MLHPEARALLNRLMDGEPNGLEQILITREMMYFDADGLYAGTLSIGELVRGMPSSTRVRGRPYYWTVIRDGLTVFVFDDEAVSC